MGRAKEIVIKVIPANISNAFIRKHHYSGKVGVNVAVHFGCFLDGRLHGVLQYGPSLDKRKLIGLVEGTEWNNFLELNRMAFDDYLPRNSESYCIGKTLRMIHKQAPQVKWVVSYADACECGDGTIYRATNFILTGIRENKNICELPNGKKVHKIALATTFGKRPELGGATYMDITGGSYNFKKYVDYTHGKILEGFQLRYIYFLDKSWRKRLTVPKIPFSKIDEMGAGMYKGVKVTRAERHAIKTQLSH